MDNEVLCTFESSYNPSILSLGELPPMPVLSTSEDSSISKIETRDDGILTTLSISSKRVEKRENEIIIGKNCKCVLL